MEGKPLSGTHMMPGRPYGFQNLQGSLQLRHEQNPHLYNQGSSVRPQTQDVFPLRLLNLQEHDRPGTCSHNKDVRGKNLANDNNEMNCMEEGIDWHDSIGKEKKRSPWHRMKWTEEIVKLLITIVSYIGEDSSSDCITSGRSKSSLLQKKGKWKCVSEVMAERGHHISPQQCEDKFNDLNKRYKRLNDILGRGTSCKVVENPKLLDVMDLPEKAKEDVKKILSSRHLFYEEMCSYHNGNRLYLPHDLGVQQSLQLALSRKGGCEPHDLMLQKTDDEDDEDWDAEADGQDEECRDNGGTFVRFEEVSAKRLKRRDRTEDMGFCNPVKFLENNQGLGSHRQKDYTDLNHVCTGSGKANELREQWLKFRSLQLEEQKLQIKAQMLELEKQHFEWQRMSWKHGRELEKLRLENERMKLENEHMELEFKHKKILDD
ncbi:uncharacterized protein LOC122310709 isoform X1 [Carya illinoinensis]|uniref:Myb/SANT-like DNA-binding domain-containing protein n=1 Tax=Carya illinoinensis TaxID=32201 RepID=A0A8T1QEZ3_CARIL|nr:uncharacterized protein LOC122310709 isoform X1 [Carya illinoinensis]XP_042980759.1 uncharacterized protein LOC122310709 isoform X1 [Carya illinoinensis]KAG6652943.1 hypothetical protein CIPAW_05G040900 [Carya illinoinensis]